MHKEILAELAKGQHPYATIPSCSDSQVPPELIFDAVALHCKAPLPE
jgi:carbonic anhydrase